eukprot:tig00020629_g12469.t1
MASEEPPLILEPGAPSTDPEVVSEAPAPETYSEPEATSAAPVEPVRVSEPVAVGSAPVGMGIDTDWDEDLEALATGDPNIRFAAPVPIVEKPEPRVVVQPNDDSRKFAHYDSHLEKGKCAVVADAKYVRPFSEIGRLVQTDKARVVGDAKYAREAELRGTATIKQEFERDGQDIFSQHVREWGSVYTSHEVKPHEVAIGGRVEKFSAKPVVSAGKDVFLKAAAPQFKALEPKQYGKHVADLKTVATSEKHYADHAAKKFISNVDVHYDKVERAPLQKIPVAYEGRTICPDDVPAEFRDFLRVTTQFDVKSTKPIQAGPYKAVISRQDYVFDYDLNLVKDFHQDVAKTGTVPFTQRGVNLGVGTYAREEVHQHHGIYYVPGKELGTVKVFECAVPAGRQPGKAVAKNVHTGAEEAKKGYVVTGVAAEKVVDVQGPLKWSKISGTEKADVAKGEKAAQKLGVVPGDAAIYDPHEHGALAPASGHVDFGIASGSRVIFPPTCSDAGGIVRGCKIAGLGALRSAQVDSEAAAATAAPPSEEDLFAATEGAEEAEAMEVEPLPAAAAEAEAEAAEAAAEELEELYASLEDAAAASGAGGLAAESAEADAAALA